VAKEHYIVVGGTSGIGRSFVGQLSQRDGVISLLGRRASAEMPAASATLQYFQTDLADSAATVKTLESAISQSGKISHIIMFHRYRGKEDAWLGELQISLTATKTILEYAAGHFEVGGNCSVVVIGSNAARFVFSEQPVSYHAAKAALVQMVRYYAVTLGQLGVRVNMVTPDAVMKDESRPMYEKNPQLRELYESITPLGRMGTPTDVANVIDFFCSRNSEFITGQEIVVDGGLSLPAQSAVARKVAGMDKLRLTR
jgi:NAD(P)-dependent dehydrogenase (short-subunit alcohol dehydrogenase family)